MKPESSNRNRNTILEEGLTGTSVEPAVNVMTCKLCEAGICCKRVTVFTLHAKWQFIYAHKESASLLNPLTLNDLKRRRAVSPLKIKIPSKNMRENQQILQLFIQFINYVW
jgi:hypothetical protein